MRIIWGDGAAHWMLLFAKLLAAAWFRHLNLKVLWSKFFLETLNPKPGLSWQAGRGAAKKGTLLV